MDVSPSRNSIGSGSKHVTSSLSPGRKDLSKSIPKLNGEQILKQKVESKPPQPDSTVENVAVSNVAISTTANSGAETKPNFTRSKTLAAAQNSAQTKIPMKRAGANTTTKSATTPRLTHRQQMRSASKISLTIKEVGAGKKLEPNMSKLSFKANTSTNLKTPHTKAQTARSTGVSKRSASTVSCRSDNRKTEETLSQLTKVSSAAGDQETGGGGGQVLSARERVVENNKLKVFEGLQRKLQDMQTDFMQKFETLKRTSPDKLKTDFKFITMVRNDEYKLVLKDDHMVKMPKKLPADSVNDFKEKVRSAVESSLVSVIDNLKDIQSDPDRMLNLDDAHNFLGRQQNKKMQDLFECVNTLANAKDTEMDAQIVRMQKEIQEGKKALQIAEKKLTELKAIHTSELEALEKDLKEKTDADTMKRENQIAEMNRKLRNLEKQHDKLKTTLQQNTEECSHGQTEKAKLLDELKNCKDNIQALNKKLTHAENQLNHEKKDKHEKNDTIQKLEVELEKYKKELEEALQAKPTPEQHNHEKELKKEIHKLKGKVENLEKEKQEFITQVEQLQEDIQVMDKLRHRIHDLEEENRDLLAREKTALENVELPKEFQAELCRLRQSEAEKVREIEKLKIQLSKAHYNIEQLEEQIRRDQQLLEVRSELINSLQTNDHTQRIQLDQIFAEVGVKNNTINELNNDLRTKSEEFQNLFNTLSNKQMELSRQEHMIKLLEESNERSQMLRVKQEEKIGRMEEEIARLKQTIALYQHNVLGNTGCKNLIYQPVVGAEDYNENLYYYTSERRRKRQVDINVKKYEV
ncbi:putative leucine-rich repeat-containing protein DDB_G0290503 isoform X3 [Bactrocera dorsalis]|uniref:Leucine-rich repeat-containing protein DDB_G0290503 isoform X3 n=1 Tax=Bactrocera dorsalis TaxID=27457 RepID=A0ABM3JIB3_BACDO|nr:putative leucine-rich repeat-containing protein DDB_G0290503 isoform X3 [Bactrocera dorsalis]